MKESISHKLSLLAKNEIKVYPEHNGRKMAVCIWDSWKVLYRKTKNVGEYKHTTATINKALENTVDHVFNLLKNRTVKS